MAYFAFKGRLYYRSEDAYDQEPVSAKRAAELLNGSDRAEIVARLATADVLLRRAWKAHSENDYQLAVETFVQTGDYFAAEKPEGALIEDLRAAYEVLEAMLMACPVREGGTTHRDAEAAIVALKRWLPAEASS